MLVFIGTLAVSTTNQALAVGLAFAAAAVGAVYAFGHVSGAHINPAVTIGLALRQRFPWREALPYIIAQIIGSTIAAFVHFSIVGTAVSRRYLLGATFPGNYGVTAAMVMELMTTFILVLVVLGATEKEAAPGFAGLAIGLILGLNVTIAYTISGGSMNPARSLGPALALVLTGIPFNTAFAYHWIYWIAPILGGILAALVHSVKS